MGLEGARKRCRCLWHTGKWESDQASHFVLVSWLFFIYFYFLTIVLLETWNKICMGKSWLFSAHISSQRGNLETTGNAQLILSEGELGPKEVCGTAGPAVDVSPAVCITATPSWLRALAFCASLDTDSHQKGKYKATFWWPTIWCLVDTTPKT